MKKRALTPGGKVLLGCSGVVLAVCLAVIGFGAWIYWVGSTRRTSAPGPQQTPISPLPAAASPGQLTAGKWAISTGGVSKVDDSKTVTLWLDAESTISGWPGKTHRPVLFLRCQEKKTAAYVTTGMAANVEYGHYNEASVTLRFDQQPAKKMWASESTDNEAVFLPSAIGQIRTMAKAERMLFRFTPFNSNQQETEFDLRGLERVLPYLQEACGWR